MEKEQFNQIKYNNEFNREHYDRTTIMLPKGKKDVLKEFAKKNGYSSLNALIITAIDEYIKKNI